MRRTTIILTAVLLSVIAVKTMPPDQGEAFITVVLLNAIGIVLLSFWEEKEAAHRVPRRLFCAWNVVDVLLALCVFQLVMFGLSELTRASFPAAWPQWVPSGMTGLGSILMCVMIFAYLRRRYGLMPGDVGLRASGGPRVLLLVLGFFFAVRAFQLPMTWLFSYLHALYRVEPEIQQVLQHMREVPSLGGLIVTVVVAAVVAPVTEEIMFRGVLQPFFRRYLGGAGSIIVVAVLFSLVHEPTSRFMMTPALIFPLALALGYCYHRTQSLTAPILLHALHNLLPVVMLLHQRATAS